MAEAAEVHNKPIRYQWTVGEKIGTVEILNSEVETAGIVWLVFESGNRCNKSLVKSYMYALGENEPALQITANFDEVRNQNSGGVDPAAGLDGNTNKSVQKNQKSPLRILLEKQAENNEQQMAFTINVKLPKPEVYSILRDSFENADEELTNMLIQETDIKQIKEQLKDKIELFIKSYYKNGN